MKARDLRGGTAHSNGVAQWVNEEKRAWEDRRVLNGTEARGPESGAVMGTVVGAVVREGETVLDAAPTGRVEAETVVVSELAPRVKGNPMVVVLKGNPMAVVLWRVLAVVALGLGVVGAVLPVMPTVPFVILSAWAAGKGWPALEEWLLNHRWLGPPVVKWRERGAIPRRMKALSSVMMTSSAVGLQFFERVPLGVRVAIPLVMVALGVWVWTRPDD